MESESIVLLLIFVLFLYFGYKDDFKRNPSEFSRTILGVILSIVSTTLGFFGLIPLIKKWTSIKKDTEETE